jgi:TM2 domain-containing membrane protein YozV/cold shock CspA family protein
MRGKVLAYDSATGQGTISGDDGSRYALSRNSLGAGVGALMPGKTVDFVVQGGVATDVYPLPGAAGEKNKWIAAVLALFLGSFGVHKFYLGRKTAGLIMLLCSVLGFIIVVPMMIVMVISVIEGIIYIVRSEQSFHDLYVAGDRAWF